MRVKNHICFGIALHFLFGCDQTVRFYFNLFVWLSQEMAYAAFIIRLPEAMYTTMSGGSFSLQNNSVFCNIGNGLLAHAFVGVTGDTARFQANGGDYFVDVTVGHTRAPYRGTIKIEMIVAGDSNYIAFQSIFR